VGKTEITKAKLEAARKRKQQMIDTKDMLRSEMGEVRMEEKVDEKIKKIRR
jgi:hypothetical protein